MQKSLALAAGLMAAGLMAQAAGAAPLGASRDHPAAGERLVEAVQYRRDCYWTGSGWGYKYGGKVLVCKPHKPVGHWVWHHEGHRHGWYHPVRKVWHYNKW